MTKMPEICEACGKGRTKFLAERLQKMDSDCPVCRANYDIERSDPEGVRARGKEALDGLREILTPGRKLH